MKLDPASTTAIKQVHKTDVEKNAVVSDRHRQFGTRSVHMLDFFLFVVYFQYFSMLP